MRPATLAEAIKRIVDGAPREKALPEFLDTFYFAPTAEKKLAAICDRPMESGDPRLDAFAGAAAEYLARQYQLPSSPSGCLSRSGFSIAPGMSLSSTIPACANI
jgi:hypothetical protein